MENRNTEQTDTFFEMLRRLRRRSEGEVSQIFEYLGCNRLAALLLRENIDGESLCVILFDTELYNKEIGTKWDRESNHLFFEQIYENQPSQEHLTQQDIEQISNYVGIIEQVIEKY